MHPSKQPKHAFTIIELLVVVAIIGVLVAVMLPAISQARESARKILCAGNQRQCGIGFASYQTTYNQWLPIFDWDPIGGNLPLAALNLTDENFGTFFGNNPYARTCPNFIPQLPAPSPNNFGITSVRLKTSMGFGYSLLGIDSLTATAMGDRRVNRSSAGAIQFIRPSRGGNAVDTNGDPTAYYGKYWDPYGTRPLMADSIAYNRGNGRLVIAHPADRGPSKRIIPAFSDDSVTIPSLMPYMATSGSNHLAWDGHVQWMNISDNPRNDERIIATRYGGASEGWTSAATSRFTFYYAKPAGPDGW